MKLLRNILILLLVLAVGMFGSQWLSRQPPDQFGQIVVRVGGYDYIGSLPHAALALLIAIVLVWLLWKLLSLPFRAWSRHRRKQGRSRLIEGLNALQAGQWARAEKLLANAAGDEEVGTIALAAAVRAADARGDEAAAARHLQSLSDRAPLAAALLRAERALDRRQPGDALAALEAAELQPLPPRGLLLRAQALAADGHAGEAYGLLGPLKQQNALPPPALAALETGWAAQSLREAGDGNALAARWEGLTKALRLQPDVAAAYATHAAAMHWDDAASHSLEQAIDAGGGDRLVALYGLLPINKYDSRRASAQRWLQARPDDAALLLTLGRLARRQGQWMQARDFLHRALANGAGSEAWEELAEGLAAAGDSPAALTAYANALKLARGETVAAPVDTGPATVVAGGVASAADAATPLIEERNEHGVPRLRE